MLPSVKFAEEKMLVFTALHGMQTRSSHENSVRLSNGCIVTKRKKDLSRFLYHTKGNLAQFSEKKNSGRGQPHLPEILGQPAPIGAKSPIFARIPQP